MMGKVAQTEFGMPHPTVQGLATVAMLKVNFDAGRDHISMFEPFVRDVVASNPSADMDLKEVTAGILERHELGLPVNTLRTLLNRIVRQGYLRREGGRYFRTEKVLSSDDVLESRKWAETRQRRLAEALIEHAAKRGIRIDSPEDALGLIMSFMESYHVKLTFDEPPEFDSAQLEETTASPQHVATALFLREAIVSEGEFSDVIQETLEGFVLQNTLLLKDVASAGRQFKDLHVIADSQILFGALGLLGAANETATLELLDLLDQTGARVSVFQPTIQEMKRVLFVYEEKIGTAEGREELNSSDLTRHFFAERFTPSDVRQQAALLEVRLKKLGINVRELPDRASKWTMDEEALACALTDEGGRQNQPRVKHDVDCVAGVLTYRKGKISESLDTARAVFVTNSGMTVRNTRHWYRTQDGKGFPPIIHVLSLSNYAWLKRPASAAGLKVHELVALCAAALRPSRKSWEHFVEYLRGLEESGEISSDEVAAVVASELTQNIMAEEGIDEESDAASLSEVVERVKARFKEEADKARTAADESAAEVLELRKRIRAQAAAIARSASLVIGGVLALCLILGTIIGIVDTATGARPSPAALVLGLAPLAIVGLLGVLSGFHLRAWTEKMEKWLTAALERWTLHGHPCAHRTPDESEGMPPLPEDR